MLVKQFLFGLPGHGEQLLPGLAASNADGIFDGNGGVIRKVYMGVVNNPGYRSAVSALLTLYIMFTALSYLAGNVQLTHTELIVRVGKIAIVSALLSSEYSWSFFNDYLFVYFIGGVEQILQIIVEAGATGPGSPGILAMMIAPQTIAKLLSLLFIDWLGFIYIILFFIALYFILMIFFNAAVIYLSALIAIGMIIVMGPIFMCFLLFGITRSLFENWLKQLISYAVQPIILFTGLIFISMILRQEIYGALGFRVCKQSFPKMTETPSLIADATKATLGFDPGNSMFYWWFPKPMKGEQFTKTTVPIPVPIDHFANTDGNVIGDVGDGGFCEAYGCIENRYIDLPFLDPVNDQRRITQFWNGKFVQLDGLLLIFVALYLLHKFNGLTVAAAKFITGTSGNYTNISNVGDAVHAQTFGSANAAMASAPRRLGQAAMNEIDQGIGNRQLKASGEDMSKLSASERKAKAIAAGRAKRNEYSASAMFDKAKIRSLKRESTTGRASKSVLAETEKKTGLKQSDVNPNAIKDYKSSLSSKLKDIDPTLSDAKARKLADKMSKKGPDQLQDELSKAKYGKKHKDLDTTQKAELNKLNDRELRKLARDSDKARTFRNAYVDSFIGMSDKGVGLVGKHNKTIRSVEEINHEKKERERVKKAKRMQGFEEGLSGVSRAFGDTSQSVIDTTDSMNRTPAEILADNREGFGRSQIDEQVDSYNKRYGESVLSPEFLARAERNNHPDLDAFRSLEKRQVSALVQDSLRNSSDTATMGETYMAKYAKNSEMQTLIDNSHKVQEDIFKTDDFISRQAEYEATYELAVEDINEAYNKLPDKYQQDATPEKLVSNMINYFNDTEAMSEDQIPDALAELQKSVDEYKSSQDALKQINRRKEEVTQEIDKHVEHINGHRERSGFTRYNPEKK